MTPEIQPISPLDLAGVVVATPAAGLVKMEVIEFRGVVLVCLACVGAWLPWVLDKVATYVEKQCGPSALYGKSNRVAHSLCEHFFALVHSVVEEGEVLGVEFPGDKAGEVADLHRSFTECADDEAGNAPRVVRFHLCLDGPGCAGFCVELLGSFVIGCFVPPPGGGVVFLTSKS